MKSFAIQKDNEKYGEYMPLEDAYKIKHNAFCVADGITRDPVGSSDFTAATKEELLRAYPNPSPATEAADRAAGTFVNYLSASAPSVDAARQAMLAANKSVEELNEGKEIDYLVNDYAGCVAAGGVIADRTLYWSSIGDCQIVVFGGDGREKLKTPNGVAAFESYERSHTLGDWNKPEYRIRVRSQFRNNPSLTKQGIKVSYGALTGEGTAASFIDSGALELAHDDIVVCYSDGFATMVEQKEFERVLRQGQKALSRLDNELAAKNPQAARERTLIVLSGF